MKAYLFIAAVIAFAGAFVYYGHTEFQAGYDKRVAEERTAQDAEDKKAKTDWLKQDKVDTTNGFKLATSLDLTTTTTTTLSEAIHAPIPAPAAATRLVPNPFPAGFSLCW